jgi:hypothetical protein
MFFPVFNGSGTINSLFPGYQKLCAGKLGYFIGFSLYFGITCGYLGNAPGFINRYVFSK